MDMKKAIYLLLVVLTAASCAKQDSVYKEFVKEGGYIYPAKPLDVTAERGYQRVVLRWTAPMDPSLRTAKVFWDSHTKSKEFKYADFPDGIVSTVIDGLEDRAYTFDVVNYDADGNKSLESEITTSPFGESWLVSHAERTVKFARMEGNDAIVTMNKPTNEIAVTKFRYVNTAGETVEGCPIYGTATDVVLTDVAKGKFFEYQNAFCAADGIDTVWTGNWYKTDDAIAYLPDVSKTTLKVTANQVRESFYPELILDGIKDSFDSRWLSSNNAQYRNVWPKIIVIDSKEVGDNVMTFNKFVFYQDPDPDGQTRRYIRSVNVYVSNTKFNPDDTNYTKNYGTPVISVTLNQNDPVQEFIPEERVAGRYVAIVFRNSYNSSGFVDLWEFEAFGYAAALAN